MHSGSAPLSRAGETRRRVAERLDEAECRRHLGTGGIGRLVYNSRFGPMALPVEYKLHEGSIVFRTARDTFTEEDLRTGIAHAEFRVAVEVDQIDPQAREGWMVLVRGAAHHVDTDGERASITGAGVEELIEGRPDHFIRVVPTGFWGQRIRRA